MFGRSISSYLLESLRRRKSRVAIRTKQRVALLICALALSGSVQAQDKAQTQPGVRAINLKLSSESARVCLGSFVPLNLDLTNQTGQEIKIRKLDVWRDFSFKYAASDGSSKNIGYGIVPGRVEDYDRLRNDVFTLNPQATYTTTFKFPLTDHRFFEVPGTYTLRSYYDNMAASNIVRFETYDCNSK